MQESEFWKQIKEENKTLREKLEKLYQIYNEGEQDELRSSFLTEEEKLKMAESFCEGYGDIN